MSAKSIAVIGSGISGMSAAWLLSQKHKVTLFEKEARPGGHSNTFIVKEPNGEVPIDTGFIVYNESAYPNLVALFNHLNVETYPTNMGFAVSMMGGTYEYSGNGLSGLFGQAENLFSLRHWRLVKDVVRFFNEASALPAGTLDPEMTLGAFLEKRKYSTWFSERHILPMAAAIWSTPTSKVLDFPISSFIDFFSNHQLLKLIDRPYWRTVKGGSQEYVRKLLASFKGRTELDAKVDRVVRVGSKVDVYCRGQAHQFDYCVMAAHADETLSMLADADPAERSLLESFKYSQNLAVLHDDDALMPLRKRIWSSWNYISTATASTDSLFVTYWMNKLQNLNSKKNYFVSLNPTVTPRTAFASIRYAHPIFDAKANAARGQLWNIQGRRNVWFCGSYFGFGFHEDAIQSGLAAAESIGGVRRPWNVSAESGRIVLRPSRITSAQAA